MSIEAWEEILMEFKCKNCTYFESCRKSKDELCAAFIFEKKETEGPVTVKTERFKKG